MRFPRPRVPSWYWRMPLRRSQWYCRCIHNRWWDVWWVCNGLLTADTLLRKIPAAIRFSRLCWNADRREGLSIRHSIDFMRYYWGCCLRSWMGDDTHWS